MLATKDAAACIVQWVSHYTIQSLELSSVFSGSPGSDWQRVQPGDIAQHSADLTAQDRCSGSISSCSPHVTMWSSGDGIDAVGPQVPPTSSGLPQVRITCCMPEVLSDNCTSHLSPERHTGSMLWAAQSLLIRICCNFSTEQRISCGCVSSAHRQQAVSSKGGGAAS